MAMLPKTRTEISLTSRPLDWVQHSCGSGVSCRVRLGIGSTAVSFVPQGLDRVQSAGSTRGIEAEENSDRAGKQNRGDSRRQ